MRPIWKSHEGSSKSFDVLDDNEKEEEISFLGGLRREKTPNYRKSLLLMCCWTVWNLVSSSILLAAYFSSPGRGKNALLKMTSFYSPLLDKIDIQTRILKMDATLFPSENPSVGRQDPNPEADAVWAEWENTRTIVVTADEIRKMGKDPDYVAKLEDDFWHLGDDAYMATLDIFHQLHCLNALRKLIYPEYYNWSQATFHHPELWYIHHNHCVDILMQNIQCTGGTELVPMQWMDTEEFPFPDFSIYHQCRDFDALVKWRKENALEWEIYRTMSKPEGVKQAKQQDMYFEIFPNRTRPVTAERERDDHL